MTAPTNPEVPADAAIDLPQTRTAAIARGAPRYFTGNPCREGHLADRYTLDGYCVVCRQERQRAQRAEIMRRRQP